MCAESMVCYACGVVEELKSLLHLPYSGHVLEFPVMELDVFHSQFGIFPQMPSARSTSARKSYARVALELAGKCGRVYCQVSRFG